MASVAAIPLGEPLGAMTLAALMLAPSIVLTLSILGPVARAVAWVSRFFLRLLGVRADPAADAEEHADVLRGAIELHGHGQADEDAHHLSARAIQGISHLSERRVSDQRVEQLLQGGLRDGDVVHPTVRAKFYFF